MKTAIFLIVGLMQAVMAFPALAQSGAEPRPPARPAARSAPARPPAKPAPTPEPPAPPPPVVPQVAPAPPVLPPPIAVPTRTAPPPGPAAFAEDAPGEASPIAGGIRLTFGAGRAELNRQTTDAVRGLAAAIAAKGQASATFTVTSFASGSPDDSSAARRLSLSRGLSVRALLIGEGVASSRIYVKAQGLGSDPPPDRVDIIVADPEAPRPASPAQARPAP